MAQRALAVTQGSYWHRTVVLVLQWEAKCTWRCAERDASILWKAAQHIVARSQRLVDAAAE